MSESTYKRVYHPTLDAWHDVTDVEEWSKAGWLKSKPKHVEDSDTLPPGEFFVAPVVSDVVEPVKSAKADAK